MDSAGDVFGYGRTSAHRSWPRPPSQELWARAALQPCEQKAAVHAPKCYAPAKICGVYGASRRNTMLIPNSRAACTDGKGAATHTHLILYHRLAHGCERCMHLSRCGMHRLLGVARVASPARRRWAARGGHARDGPGRPWMLVVRTGRGGDEPPLPLRGQSWDVLKITPVVGACVGRWANTGRRGRWAALSPQRGRRNMGPLGCLSLCAPHTVAKGLQRGLHHAEEL